MHWSLIQLFCSLPAFPLIISYYIVLNTNFAAFDAVGLLDCIKKPSEIQIHNFISQICCLML